MAKRSPSKVKASQTPDPQEAPVMEATGALNPSNPAKLLSELLNRGKSNPFGNYKTLAEYAVALRGMTTNELSRHAVDDAEIVPVDHRDRLIERLETAFATYKNKIAAYTARASQSELSPERRKAIEAVMERASQRY